MGDMIGENQNMSLNSSNGNMIPRQMVPTAATPAAQQQQQQQVSQIQENSGEMGNNNPLNLNKEEAIDYTFMAQFSVPMGDENAMLADVSVGDERIVKGMKCTVTEINWQAPIPNATVRLHGRNNLVIVPLTHLKQGNENKNVTNNNNMQLQRIHQQQQQQQQQQQAIISGNKAILNMQTTNQTSMVTAAVISGNGNGNSNMIQPKPIVVITNKDSNISKHHNQQGLLQDNSYGGSSNGLPLLANVSNGSNKSRNLTIAIPPNTNSPVLSSLGSCNSHERPHSVLCVCFCFVFKI